MKEFLEVIGRLEATGRMAVRPARDALAGANRISWDTRWQPGISSDPEKKAGAITPAPEGDHLSSRTVAAAAPTEFASCIRETMELPAPARPPGMPVLRQRVLIAEAGEWDISGCPHCFGYVGHAPSLGGLPCGSNGSDARHSAQTLPALINEVIAFLAHGPKVADIAMNSCPSAELLLNDVIPRHESGGAAVRTYPVRVPRRWQLGASAGFVCNGAGHLSDLPNNRQRDQPAVDAGDQRLQFRDPTGQGFEAGEVLPVNVVRSNDPGERSA